MNSKDLRNVTLVKEMDQNQDQAQIDVVIAVGMVEYVQTKVFLQYNKLALNVLGVVKR